MNVIKDKAPDDAIVYYNLGVSAEQLEDAEAAKGFYKKAIELDPEYVNSYLNLASLILAAEQPLVDEMNELGMSSADNKRYDKLNEQKIDLYKEALPYLQSAYEADDENKSVIQTLINIHYQLGNNDKAKELKTKLDGLAE
jgi:tetratricopeptide (TPR) repeat protein